MIAVLLFVIVGLLVAGCMYCLVRGSACIVKGNRLMKAEQYQDAINMYRLSAAWSYRGVPFVLVATAMVIVIMLAR